MSDLDLVDAIEVLREADAAGMSCHLTTEQVQAIVAWIALLEDSEP